MRRSDREGVRESGASPSPTGIVLIVKVSSLPSLRLCQTGRAFFF